MWILRALSIVGDKKLIADQPEQNSPPIESIIKPKFIWPEDLRPIEEMSHTVVREFPKDSDRITIIVPGYGSSGKKPKYEDIISDILNSGTSAVISTNNPNPNNSELELYSESIRQQVIALVRYSIENELRLTGRENIKITLYGSSAGGGAAALAAGLFPEIVDSLILTGPSRDVTEGLKDELQDIVRPFTGKVFFIRTAGDPICNLDTVRQYSEILGSDINAISIPGDDHAFEFSQNHQQLRDFIMNSLNSLKVVES